MKMIIILLTLMSGVLQAGTVDVQLSETGELLFAKDARLTLEFGRENWNCRAVQVADFAFMQNPVGRRVAGKLENPVHEPSDGSYEVRCTPRNDGRLDYAFDVTSARTQRPAAFALMLYLPEAGMTGAKWNLEGGRSGVLPAASGPGYSVNARTTRFSIELPFAKKTFDFQLPEPGQVRVSNGDFRRHHGWAVSFDFGYRGVFTNGVKRTMALSVGSKEGPLALVPRKLFRVEPNELWVPLDYCKDIDAGSALDFSGFGLLDAPAGKYGWARNVGGHFEFEGRPGKRQRFCGMNICGHSMYPPTHADADRLAERFVRLGYNTFRIHTFEWKMLARTMDTLELDPEMLERLDYLYAALVKRGCYATVDLFVCRAQPYLWRRDAGIDRDGAMTRNAYKLLVKVHDAAFENWARFAKNFMTHVNPYTGKRYADDPAMPFVVFVNEEAFGWDRAGLQIPEVRAAYRKWLAAKRAADPRFLPEAPEDCAGCPLDEPALALFKVETDRAFVRRATAYLRSLGVKANFSAFNCSDREAMLQPVRGELDYVDAHMYVDHPRFAGNGGYPQIVGGTVPPDDWKAYVGMAFQRLVGKPFTVSEWNWGTTSRYRGASGLSFGSFAARQDWDILWRFTYSDSGEWWRSGDEGGYASFTCSYDPMMTASERATTCLFLRGDMPALGNRLALEVTPESYIAPYGKARPVVPPWREVACDWGVATVLPGVKSEGWKRFDLAKWGSTNDAPVACTMDARHVRNPSEQSFTVVTPRTSGGFAFPGTTLACGALTVKPEVFPATVWASALVGDRLEDASRILVTHLTDTQRHGSLFGDETEKQLIRLGKGGLLMRDGRAEISLALKTPKTYRVYALRSDGRRLEQVPAKVVDGRLCFTASVRSVDGARYLYEVTR